MPKKDVIYLVTERFVENGAVRMSYHTMFAYLWDLNSIACNFLNVIVEQEVYHMLCYHLLILSSSSCCGSLVLVTLISSVLYILLGSCSVSSTSLP